MSSRDPSSGEALAAASRAGLEFGQVHANGVDFAYLAKGSGPLILCIHGFPSSAHSFRYLIEALAAQGFRVVAPFLRGHSPSSIPEDRDYGTAKLGEDVNLLVEALGYEAAVVAGHDLGGGAAFAAALREPQRISRIISIAAPYGDAFHRWVRSDPRQIRLMWHTFILRLPVAKSVLEADDFSMIEFLWRTWSPEWRFAAADLELVKAMFRKPGAAQAAASFYRTPEGEATPREIPESPPIPAPTLYIEGSEDGVLLPQRRQDMESYFPGGLSMEVVSGAGHFPHHEKPGSVTRLILEFLEVSR